MKKLSKKSRDKVSSRLYAFIREGADADAVIEHAAAEKSPESLPRLIRDYALHRGLILDDTGALWPGLQQSVRLRYAFKKPEHYGSGASGYTHVWDVVPALAVGDADVFARWTELVPATLSGGHAWTVAISNAVTAIGRKDTGLMNDARSALSSRLATRGLGNYERPLAELLHGALSRDAAKVARAVEASVKAWPRYLGSNRWRDDWFLALDAIAFFNLARTLIDEPIAMPQHERWRIPPTLTKGPGNGLLDFSERLPMVDAWWRNFPALADTSEWPG